MTEHIERVEPAYMQVHDHYANRIASGELAPGDQLPTLRQMAELFGVSGPTVVRAVALMKSGRLVITTRDGTFVADRRLIVGPQQALSVWPSAARIEVLAAELIDAPEYVRPILGLEPDVGSLCPVLRREQVSFEQDGAPFMLTVQWYRPELYESVPELAEREPVDEAGGAVKLIERRTGRHVTSGTQAREARPAKDDGREGELLQIAPGTAVLAEVWTWADDRGVIEYGEAAIIQNRVTENRFTL